MSNMNKLIKRYTCLNLQPRKFLKETKNVEHEIVEVENIWLDYELHLSPHLYKVIHSMRKWWKKYYTYLTFLKYNPISDMCLVACYSHPNADVRQLEALVIQYTWAISFDDEILEQFSTYEEAISYKKDFLKHFDEKNLEKALNFSIYCLMILEVYLKLEIYMSDNQKARFRKELEFYLDAAANETKINEQRSSNTIEYTLEEFMNIRLKSSSFAFYELYGEICDEADMSKYYTDETFQNNRRAITGMVTFLNDIYSYNRELKLNLEANLVMQVQKHYGCSTQKAMQLSVDIFRKEKKIFDETSTKLIEKYPHKKEIKRYIYAMRNWALANCLTYKYYFRYTDYNEFSETEKMVC